MSAELRGSSGDASGSADQPRPADRQPVTPVPSATDQAAGAEARRQKYAHLTEGRSQGREDPLARHQPGTDTAAAAGKPPPAPDTAQGTGNAARADRPGTRPPEAHALSDRRYQTLEEYQKVRHAQPPGEHVAARHPHNADHGPTGSPAGHADHGRTSGHHTHGMHAAGEARSATSPGADAGAGSGDGAQDGPAQDGRDSPAQPHVTHYQAKFSGEQFDLWTDGQGHWASDYRRADDALPIDHVADVRSRMPASHDGPAALPETVYVDGGEVEVTHDPEEGVWFGGMGEVPEAPEGDPNGAGHAGEAFDGGYEKTKSAEVKATLWSKGETVNDVAENVSDEVGRLFDRPQGKAEVNVQTHHDSILQAGVDHGVYVPDAAKAILAAGLLTWEVARAAHKGYDKAAEWMRGQRHARD
jgi:hypothetical protein